MQVKCPECNASFSLVSALALDAGRSALLTALQMPAPLAQLLAQYLGMFRAKKRALAFDRVDSLLAELQPMFASGTVTRNGLTRPCTLALWQQGIEKIIELRNDDKLELPLKSHGYLLEIVLGLANTVGAKEEKAQEAQRRSGTNRAEGDERMRRQFIISSARGDVELGLITLDEAKQRLRDAGISPEVLNG